MSAKLPIATAKADIRADLVKLVTMETTAPKRPFGKYAPFRQAKLLKSDQ
jgi:hypothetical protein